jgi:hypothetical protein
VRRYTAYLAIAAASAVALSASPLAAGAPPPGASAKCRDGSYSFSKHRSGTCSYHGGVAVWLEGGGTSTTPATRIDVGVTVLLAKRTMTSGCKVGPSPDRRCSPGAYYSKLTKAVICSSGFRTSSIRNVPQSVKFAVEGAYGLVQKHYGGALEIDHIVSLELGGSNDVANLFPENADTQRPGYHAKDRLENRLHDMVCRSELTLRSAQRRIAANWQALYKRVYAIAP